MAKNVPSHGEKNARKLVPIPGMENLPAPELLAKVLAAQGIDPSSASKIPSKVCTFNQNYAHDSDNATLMPLTTLTTLTKLTPLTTLTTTDDSDDSVNLN